MAGLKLGKLPDRNTVKLTFSASAELFGLLEDYAALYEKIYGKREKLQDLIPVMLDAFIKSDVGFRKARKEKSAMVKKSQQL